MLDQENQSDNGSQNIDEGQSAMVLVSYYWSLLRKYYWIILLTSIVSIAMGYFYTRQQPRLYRTSAKIIFHNQQNVFGERIDQVNLMAPETWKFEQFWNTQREVLGSRWFNERVAKRLGMLEGDKFVPVMSGDKPISEEKRMHSAVSRIKGMVTFDLQRDSRVVLVTAVSDDPVFAKAVADEVTKTFVDYAKEVQSSGLTQIVRWFDSYVADKQKELEAAQIALQQFKRDQNILSVSFEDRQNLTASNMEAVNAQLNEVKGTLTQVAALKAELQQIKTATGSDEAAARFAKNTLVEGGSMLSNLITTRRDLERRLAENSTVFGPKHATITSLNEQLALVEGAINEEVRVALTEVQSRYSYLTRQQTTLEKRLEEIRGDAFGLNDLGLEYNKLRDRADSLQELYKTVLDRSKELDLNSLYDSDSIQMLEDAEVPAAPFSPNLPSNLGAALVFGLGFGIGIIFLIAALDNTVKREEDIRRVSRVPLLGTLPAVDPQTLRGVGAQDYEIDIITKLAPKSSFAEGVKTLRTNLMFMAGSNPPRVLLVTSPGPGEGKTLISSNMAIAMAQSGLKTLIIDLDLRRPRIHKALGVTNDLGMADMIKDKTPIDAIIHKTDVLNLDVIPAGKIPPNPTELLHSPEFDRVLAELRERYDRVIIDSPPIGAVADALILSRSADGVLLVLKYAQTRRDMFKRVVEQLEGIGAPLMGCVLNDIKRNSPGYGYSYYSYRYGNDEAKSKPNNDRLAS